MTPQRRHKAAKLYSGMDMRGFLTLLFGDEGWEQGMGDRNVPPIHAGFRVRRLDKKDEIACNPEGLKGGAV